MIEFTYKKLEDGTYCVMGYEGDEAVVAVPETYGGAPVTIIYDNLFKGHSEITHVAFPDTVTSMGEFIFDGCENIREIKLSSQLTSIWGYTFVRCGIEEITLPDSLISLPPFAFKDCKNLKRVVCGTGLKKIYAWAFSGCDRLEAVLFGPGVEVSPQAFQSKELNT